MPVDKKDLIGVIMTAHACTVEEQKRAFDAGTEAHRGGKQLADCPEEFLPRMGNAILYDRWVMGFRAAAVADGGGSD